MTAFRPKQPKERWEPRIWNPQLIRYAAYEQPDDSILGDPANLEVTKAIVKLGSSPPEPNTYFTARYVGQDGAEVEDNPPVAVPTTVAKVLSEELDLSLREPFNDLLAYLHSAAQNPQEKYRLETWLEILRLRDDHPDSIAFKKTITDNFMSVADLFDEFPSAAINLAALLELLPQQKPRLYSISSCALLHPNRCFKSQLGCCKSKPMRAKFVRGSVPTTSLDLNPERKFVSPFAPVPSVPPATQMRSCSWWDREPESLL